MSNLKKPELLAPAGDLEKLKTALAFGADAVYFGLPDFSLRVRINDFTWASLKEAVKITHQAKKKAYVTLNIFAHNQHLAKLASHVKKLRAIGPDALFISDPGVLKVVKTVWPQAKISLSTQANCTNWQAAKFWQAQGFKRIILSRELPLKSVAEIIKKNPQLEIETFVHGALCMAYSGRCFLSALTTGRNANLGDCVQPCRFEYEITAKGSDQPLTIGQDNHGSYLLNSLDLCLLKRLPEIIKIGVSALKIEGRAKSVYYLANVVGAYRQAIDLIFSAKSVAEKTTQLNFLYHELASKLVHRGFTEGFMFAGNTNLQNLTNSKILPAWEFCGQVLNCQKQGTNNFISTLQVHNTLKVGDRLELVLPPYQVKAFKLTAMKLADTGKNIVEAHGGGGGQQIILETNYPVPTLSVLRRHLPKTA